MKSTVLIAAALGLAVSARPDANGKPRLHARDLQVERYFLARPVWNAQLNRREVPQEHSHNKFLATVDTFLRKDNPDNIVDSVFGLLGDAAAAGGQGSVSNTDCLQQATADRAFTNAKAAGDVDGMTAALVYRALERNTGKVGLASVACTAIKAVNPEIAAISEHQDPASPNAAATNKAITLALAKQIASIGGDPQTALQSGTFKPGNLNDLSGKGNTCDTENDTEGCIFTQNLLVEDATPDEINAAVGGAAKAPAAKASAANTPAAPKEAAQSSSSSEEEDDNEQSGCDNPPPPPPPPPSSSVDCSSEVAAALASASAGSGSNTAPAAAASSSSSSSAKSSGSSKLDLGSCPNPTIIFANGLDGRNQPAFAPADEGTFTHGSALGIKVITDFICQQLQVKCKASQDTIDACNKGATAAQGATGQAAADAFNNALGFK